MIRAIVLACVFTVLLASTGGAEMEFSKDPIQTSSGVLEITFVGHGSLMMAFDGKVIHIDPWSALTDYSGLPKADIILITHDHRDHLDPNAIELIRSENTDIIAPEKCADRVDGAIVMRNGDVKTVGGLKIEAVPAYNVIHMRSEGNPFHPKGEGNGYVIAFGDKKIYIAGDTENTPEMKGMRDIDVAFLPMNLPYTMTPDMVADAARAFRPGILYPYHYGDTDTSELIEALKDEDGIDVRVRKL